MGYPLGGGAYPSTVWYMPVIPAPLEAEVGESWSRFGQGKSMTPQLKNNLESERTGAHG
jgi:hypothetical protein